LCKEEIEKANVKREIENNLLVKFMLNMKIPQCLNCFDYFMLKSGFRTTNLDKKYI